MLRKYFSNLILANAGDVSRLNFVILKIYYCGVTAKRRVTLLAKKTIKNGEKACKKIIIIFVANVHLFVLLSNIVITSLVTSFIATTTI
jgi:hypothetical protein